MKYSAALCMTALCFIACLNPKPDKDYSSLPELPEDLLSQIDTTTMATKSEDVVVLPTRDSMSGVALAPCCGSRTDRSLQVTMSYTKCGPWLDFVLANMDDMVLHPGDSRRMSGDTSASDRPGVYRLNENMRRRFNRFDICVTSNGPWNAVLTENRSCNGYSPHYSLTVMPYGDLILRQWVGGIQHHPAEIGLVSCRLLSKTQFRCGGLSSCECLSTLCQAPDPCDCGIQNEW